MFATDYKISSLKFVSNCEGNMGTTLDYSWLTKGAIEEESEEEQYSENPLASGLLHSVVKENDAEDGSPDASIAHLSE